MPDNTRGNSALPFEEPLEEIRRRIEELRGKSESTPALDENLSNMQNLYGQLQQQLYSNLTPWNTVEIARHPKRPQVRDYIEKWFGDDFVELHGDRSFRDDLAIVTGLANLGHHRIMFVGQHKGRDVKERHLCHAGCPHPEGYWKALRKMKIAERFGLPVVCLIDTKGAYPGIGSEERGVAIAIAENLLEMSRLKVPIVCVVIGEGGSGGALGIGIGDRVLMLRHAYYSVISPEGCASILWRDGNMKAQAAAVLKLTSRDLKGNNLIDDIIEEPMGGAHRDPDAMAKTLREALIGNLDELVKIPIDELVDMRYAKYRAIGDYFEGQVVAAVPTGEAAGEEEAESEEE